MTDIVLKRNLKRRMRNYLIAVGMQGVAQSVIKKRFRTKSLPHAVVEEVLVEWSRANPPLAESFVARLPWSDKPVTLWRGTVYLRTTTF